MLVSPDRFYYALSTCYSSVGKFLMPQYRWAGCLLYKFLAFVAHYKSVSMGHISNSPIGGLASALLNYYQSTGRGLGGPEPFVSLA